ncbi:hypothetical protein H4P12_02115 [Paracoccus sp. 11-3]|uniref:Patatin-like phospholipase n=1 Tax=Paracoccus amoyensis TaxID=2760093 RepID=A0A926JA00_9RHOB|nr:hypothetical protein [Paracoccus amoyensis]MBC9245531.1 hypothetical protein [Paracoccus amoyensis]
MLVSVLFSLAIATLDPAHEALLGVVENVWRDAAGMFAGLATVLAFIFLPPTLHQATRYALNTERYFSDHNTQIEHLLLTWVGRLPLLGAAIGCLAILMGEDRVSDFARIALIAFMALLLLFVATGIGVFLPRNRVREALYLTAGDNIMTSTTMSSTRSSLWRHLVTFLVRAYRVVVDFCGDHRQAATVISAMVLALIGIFPSIAIWFGPIAVTLLAISILAFALAALTRLSTTLCYGQIPLIFAIIGLIMAASGRMGSILFLTGAATYCFAVFFYPGKTSRRERVAASILLLMAATILGWTSVRGKECLALSGCNLIAGLKPAHAPQEMTAAFAVWQAARPSDEKDGPIRLIAAEGGGLFAAYYTAMYLAKQTDLQGPEFARSIFAISGVSGGSIGATTFWAIRKSGWCDSPRAEPDCHQQAVRRILGRDYLSPVLARMFTWDAVDTVLPVSSLDPSWRLERGQQLENALVHNAAFLSQDSTALSDTLSDSWSADAQVPALMLNATHVATGDRIILSPFSHAASDGQLSLPMRLDLAGGRDFPVVSAAFISARFPMVTAPARVQIGPYIRQYVDGGYFDNSGIETIHDLLRHLPAEAVARTRVIALTTAQPGEASANDLCKPSTGRETDVEEAARGLFGAPLASLFGARRSHQKLSWDRARNYWDNIPVQQAEHKARFTQLPLELYDLNYTVSWYLDQNSFCGIEDNLNRKLSCDFRNDAQIRPRLSRLSSCMTAAEPPVTASLQ